MEQHKTLSQEYRDEEAWKEAVKHMDWHLLRELRILEMQYLSKMEDDTE